MSHTYTLAWMWNILSDVGIHDFHAIKTMLLDNTTSMPINTEHTAYGWIVVVFIALLLLMMMGGIRLLLSMMFWANDDKFQQQREKRKDKTEIRMFEMIKSEYTE